MGTKSNRDAVGARVTLRAGGSTQMREVVLGDGYASQSTLRLHFGLGRQPRGRRADGPLAGLRDHAELPDVPAGRIVEITEGEDRLSEKRYGAPAQ